MIKIDKSKVGDKYKPFIVAEMSGNHNQSINNALKIIDEASKCGVDAVKIQTYTADTLTINSKKSDFQISDKKVYGKINLYMNCIKRHIPHGSGTKNI